MRHPNRSLATSILLLSLAPLAAPAAVLAAPEEHQHAGGESLGKVHFEVSCGADHQAAFDRAVALLHSFGYEQAAAAFNEIAAARPDCGMAYWGAAMSDFHQVWGPPSDAEWARGRAAFEKARQVGAPSERERDWIAALAAYYVESAPRSHPQRVLAYTQAMDGLATKYPQDHEAQIFHALAILAVAYNSPPDKTYARQKQAAAILARELKEQPEHPGIAHYMIHSFDYPDLAPLALDAARAYAKIAPAAPHALHMPSHIFTRLGLWQDSIASNLASADAARAIAAKNHPGATPFEGLHAMDYLEYAYLQIANDAEARRVVDSVAQAKSFDVPSFSAGYALAAVPSRYALERRAWTDAASLAPAPATFPWEKFPYAEAIVHFARAVGAARSGALDPARSALARLSAIESGLAGQKGFDWATQVRIQRLAAAGWIAHAERKDDEALQSLHAAADLEDTTDKHPVTPGSVLPAREQLGDLLALLGKPREALQAYERSLETAPARYNSLLGAAEAAAKLGDGAKARALYERLVSLCAGSTSERAKLARQRLAGIAK